jgi:hypothetical protein
MAQDAAEDAAFDKELNMFVVLSPSIGPLFARDLLFFLSLSLFYYLSLLTHRKLFYPQINKLLSLSLSLSLSSFRASLSRLNEG